MFFYWLLQNIESAKTTVEGIRKAILFIERNKDDKTSSLNFILSNGKKLFALRKGFINPDYYSLYYLNRDPKKTDISNFQSKETKLLISSKLLREEKAVIICSEKLTEDEDWILIPNHSLLIVDESLNINRLNLDGE